MMSRMSRMTLGMSRMPEGGIGPLTCDVTGVTDVTDVFDLLRTQARHVCVCVRTRGRNENIRDAVTSVTPSAAPVTLAESGGRRR